MLTSSASPGVRVGASDPPATPYQVGAPGRHIIDNDVSSAPLPPPPPPNLHRDGRSAALTASSSGELAARTEDRRTKGWVVPTGRHDASAVLCVSRNPSAPMTSTATRLPPPPTPPRFTAVPHDDKNGPVRTLWATWPMNMTTAVAHCDGTMVTRHAAHINTATRSLRRHAERFCGVPSAVLCDPGAILLKRESVHIPTPLARVGVPATRKVTTR